MTNKFQKKIFLFSIFTTNVMSSELTPKSCMAEYKNSCGDGETGGGTETNTEEINNSSERLDTNVSTDDEKEEELKGKEMVQVKDKNKDKESELREKSEKDKERIPSEEKDKENDKGSRKGNENINKKLDQIREKAKTNQNKQNEIPLHKFCSEI